MRHTGIPIIGDVAWGTHFCQFYEGKQDLVETLVPYFKAGLENNEFCMWVTSDPLRIEEAEAALAAEVPGLRGLIDAGQIEILDYGDWYLHGGCFDSDRVLQDWVSKLESARRRGYDGLRLTGNTFWLEKSDWRSFTEYEAKVDSVIGRYPMLAICTYSLARCGAIEIMDVMSNHAFALIKRAGQWQTIESAERKRVEGSLRESEERYRQLFETMLEGVVYLDADGRITAINPSAERILDWKGEDVLGRTLADLEHGFCREDGTPLPAREHPSVAALNGGQSVRNVVIGISRDGGRSSRRVEINAVPLFRPGSDRPYQVHTTFADVTDRKSAEEALRISERRVRMKLDSILSAEGDIGNLEFADIIDARAVQSLMDSFYKFARIPMSLVDLKGNVLAGVGWQRICSEFHWVHPEACRHCLESDLELSAGIPEGEYRIYRCKNNMWDLATPIVVGGRKVGNLFSGQFFFEDEPLDTEPFRAQAARYGFDEDEYLRALASVPRLSRQTVDAGMAFFTQLAQMLSRLSYGNIKLARSLSERDTLMASLRESEKNSRILAASERSARNEAERANRVKDEFLANLSHELRTPLSAIHGWVQILRRGTPDARTMQQGLEVLERNTRAQTQLISDLLDMSRIISGKLRLEVKNCDLSTVLEEAIEAIAPAATAKSIRIEKIIDPSAGPILGDASRLQQVFWNLLSNAIKFTPSRGRVQVISMRVNSHVEISIKDNGQGVSAEFLPYLFERFRQADSSASKKQGGLGLGLAICRHIVELHGGTISAVSEGDGRGSTFTVALPIIAIRAQSTDDPAPARSIGSPFEYESVRLDGTKILVVDDEPDTREMLARLLNERGAAVFTASSGFEALELVQRRNPDVLIGDIGMPEMDGYELVRRIRRLPAASGGKTVAIALTAFSRAEDRTMALISGYQYHLAKPVEIPELIATVAIITNRLPASPFTQADAGTSAATRQAKQAGA